MPRGAMRNKNLHTYLESDKRYIPGNITKFQGGGELEGLCPLCYPEDERPHMETMQITLHDGKEVHICDDCAYDIELYDQEQHMEERYINAVDAIQALADFQETGKPFNSFIELGSSWPANLCCACRKEIDLSSPYHTVPSAVGDTSVGTFYNMCTQCANLIGWSEGGYEFYDKCNHCEEEFPVTEDEYNYRERRGDLGKHICPKCWPLHAGPTEDSTIRHVHRRCKNYEECGSAEVIDRTVYANAKKSLRQLQEEYICDTCKVEAGDLYMAYLDSNHKYRVRIYKIENFNFYKWEIEQRTDTKWDLLTFANSYTTTSEEAVFQACRTFYKNQNQY
jgi:hypothetical protein